MKLASAQAFRDDPKLVWSWYDDRRKKILAAKPNAGHIAIANLQNHREVSVITQNVDGLHIAGSRDVNYVPLYSQYLFNTNSAFQDKG
jgi:NAD-dependent deacetylase